MAARVLFAANDISALPYLKLTPGAVVDVPHARIARRAMPAPMLHVSGHAKKAVYIQYGIKSHKAGKYEVDHSGNHFATTRA